jgi:hypothetical protein
LILLHGDLFDAIADMLGDMSFTATPYSFLRRRECDVYANDPVQPRCVVVVLYVRFADARVSITSGLEAKAVEDLSDLLGSLELEGGLLVSVDLVQRIRARRRILFEAESLCFTYREIPPDFTTQFARGEQ